MLLRAGITQPWRSLRQLLIISRRFSVDLNYSSICKTKVLSHLDEECEFFLPWLQRKADVEVSSKLYIGKSSYGRSLFASKSIQTGDCILRVPYSVQIASDNILPKVSDLLDNEIESVAKLAMILLVEQKLGKESEWAPYVSCLPQLEDMHSTIFWSESELNMITPCSVYKETIKQKAQIEKDFLTIEPVLQHFPQNLRSITFQDFMHAYSLDFLNHDGLSEAVVLNDEEKQVSEVIAERCYAPHEEILIRYGKFSNATLLLDFGFACPHNIHDQVEIQINMPHNDFLRETKLEILQGHHLPAIEDDNGFNSSWDTFIIKEVKSAVGKGKGLPQSLRAFARVLCSTSHQELNDLAMEAAQTDGRLARRPLKNSSREIEAHEILWLQITQLIEEYNASIKSLELANSTSKCKRFARRRQMALDLLTGELRVLNSVSAWLKNYCASLSP